jgi:CelD/BcsL family acetyltransferase involved in cellulose biosynthesis
MFGERSLRVRGRRPLPCPRIALPADFDEYLMGLQGSHRASVRKHLRRLDGGQVELREVTDVGMIGDAVGRWHHLHQKRWASHSRRIEAAHATTSFREFMEDAMRALVPEGLATVWEFHADGDVAGVYLNLIDEDSFYWYLGGFDPARGRLGLGKLSVAQGIRWSIETGRRWFDFTRGQESFKYYFGATDRLCPAVVVGNETLRSHAVFAAGDLRDRLGDATRGTRARLRQTPERPRLAAVARWVEERRRGPAAPQEEVTHEPPDTAGITAKVREPVPERGVPIGHVDADRQGRFARDRDDRLEGQSDEELDVVRGPTGDEATGRFARKDRVVRRD